MTPLANAAREHLSSGRSVIPVSPEKRPLQAWKRYQSQAMRPAEAEASFAAAHGVALLTGYGDLEALDFDTDSKGEALEPVDIERTFETWRDTVSAFVDVDKLIIQRTPSGGFHVIYRVEGGVPDGNQKLAFVPAGNKQGRKEIIETRGAGGYLCISPTPGYRLMQGDLHDPPLLTASERGGLLEVARAFDTTPPAEAEAAAKTYKPKRGEHGSVIGRYNEAVAVQTILERNGYRLIASTSTLARYIAPDSQSGNAGVIEFKGEPPYRVFSHHGNDVLADGHAHDAFDAMRLLECAGDLKAALDRARAELGLEPFKPTQPEAVEGDDGDAGDAKKQNYSQAQLLLELAKEGVTETFHTPSGDAYAVVSVEGRSYTLELRTKDFRSYLTRRFFEVYEKPPGQQAVQDALGVLEARARFEGAEREVHVRLARHGEKIYLDLASTEMQVVEIDAQGWRVTQNSPVMFRRPKGLAPLPTPTAGGSVEALRAFVNVEDSEWSLLLAYLVSCLYPEGPYPLLILIAEQGSGKSTQARIIKSLVDPNAAPLRSAPRDERDLLIAAVNSWALAYDNLSNVPASLSDALCRLSTGGGYATRELYSNSDETIINAMRPVILTGITDLATRSDLLDRAVILNLPRLEGKRRTEKELNAAFEIARPGILGALLDAVSTGLRNLPGVEIDNPPRMADFAYWTAACEPALGLEPGSTLDAYRFNRSLANDVALADSPLSKAVQDFAAQLSEPWEGRASDLLTELQGYASEQERSHKQWPKSASALSGKLRELAPNLRQTELEIDISFNRTKRGSLIRISSQNAVTAVTASPEGDKPSQGRKSKGDGKGDGVSRGDGVDLRASPTPSPKQTPSGTQKKRVGDGGDAGDGVLQPYSNDPPPPKAPPVFEGEI